MRRGVLILVVLGLLAIPATAQGSASFTPDSPPSAQSTLLVAPNGTPIGGQWQRWANDSATPTYRGTVVVRISDSFANANCQDGADACAWPAGEIGPDPEIALAQSGWWGNADRRAALYYELAHIFTWAYVTGSDELAFERLWNVRSPTVADWMAGEASLNTAASQPKFDWFSQAYVLCAVDPDYTEASIENLSQDYYSPTLNYPGAQWPLNTSRRQVREGIRMQDRTCQQIRKIAAR